MNRADDSMIAANKCSDYYYSDLSDIDKPSSQERIDTSKYQIVDSKMDKGMRMKVGCIQGK